MDPSGRCQQVGLDLRYICSAISFSVMVSNIYGFFNGKVG